MADDANLTVTLSPAHAEVLRLAVQAGEYETEQEAFDAAIRMWQSCRDERASRLTAALEHRMAEALAAIDRGEGSSVEALRNHLVQRRYKADRAGATG